MKVTEKDYYMDGYLKTNLDIALEVVKKDWDMVFVVDGMEGSGKSVLAQQMAYYLDRNFNMRNIVFTSDKFVSTVKNAEPFSAIVYDEAYSGLNSRASLSKTNKALVRMMTEIRQKNLFIFVVIPSFFELDRYVALHRGRGLFHVYSGENFERGYFKFFNAEKKRALWVGGKKYYNYFVTKPNFYGRFTDFYPVDKITYKRKKNEALLEEATLPEKVGRMETKYINRLKILMAMLKEKGVSQQSMADRTGVTREAINIFINS